MTGDSGHKEDPFHLPPPSHSAHPSPQRTRQATDVHMGDEAAVSRALLGAPALILPL